MRRFTRRLVGATAVAVMLGCGADAQQAPDGIAVSSDPALAELAAAILPDLARRSGLELERPVAIRTRSREELIRYLEVKLDEQLPEEEARARVEAYALLGLVPESLDLRAVLLGLYTEQVAGFYEPDSTALFVLDDQPEAALQALLVHELVHAVQDQSVDLDRLTDPELGNDRSTAAQAAIEGHATLVMLEYLTEQAQGVPVDLGAIPDFAQQLRPALQALRSQFPALAGAPRVIQESLLFPYVEGASFVQSLWSPGVRVAPFGEYLPTSTEQILTHDRADLPVGLAVDVDGAEAVRTDVLGRLEVSVLLDEHVGDGGGALAEGWGGDRYALVRTAAGEAGLFWFAVWDDVEARDRFLEALTPALGRLGAGAALDAIDVDGRPGTLLTVGEVGGATASARVLDGA